MDTQKLSTVYLCCIAGGLAIPLVNLVAGAVGGALDADLDLDADGGVIPFNLMCVCLAAVIFGAVGRLFLTLTPWWAGMLCAAVLGIAGGCLLGRFVIRPLRRNDCRARNIDNLKGAQGTVRLEIRRDFVGTIAVLSATGSKVTYDAKPAQNVERIPVGAEVVVVGVEKCRNGRKVCVVLPVS